MCMLYLLPPTYFTLVLIVQGPGPNSRIVYIDGAFDLFHAGHVEVCYYASILALLSYLSAFFTGLQLFGMLLDFIMMRILHRQC